jgi:glycosyltransferase involved in cell wall biosynthesis
VREPWPLVCCGKGELASHLKGVEGIEDRGFVQPRDQPDLFASQGVFVMPSRFDPWPLVIAEASAAGLPIVCTNACGSAVELVRPMVNGVYAADRDPEDLAARMAWMHEHHADLPRMGRASRDLAQSYSAQMWAERWAGAVRELVG